MVLLFVVFKKKSKLFKFFLIVSSILISISTIFPFENLFIEFSSPDDVFKYKYNSGEIVNYIYGNNSCMLVFKQNNSTYNSCIIPKNNNGNYKIPSNWTFENSALAIGENFSYLSKVNNTNDCYISGKYVDNDNSTIDISDNYKSRFLTYSDYNEIRNQYNVSYFAIIESTDSYYLTIDNKQYTFD